VAQGGYLSIPDILAMDRVPPIVVLSGCETARADPNGPEGLGMAQAFLAAGAHQVIASVRPVNDALAVSVSKRFYAAWGGYRAAGAPLDVAPALRTALLDIAANPSMDWSTFRVIVR
jgi:CHAT domain-containing protein